MVFKKYNEKNIEFTKKNKKIELKFFQKPIRNSLIVVSLSFLKNSNSNCNNKFNCNFVKLKKNNITFFINLNKKKIF